jgi:hypothetical protein
MSAMPSRTLVIALLALRLPTVDLSTDDGKRFDELGVSPLDLVLVAIRLEDLDPRRGTFPLVELAHATTVGDLVAIVDAWWHRER